MPRRRKPPIEICIDRFEPKGQSGLDHQGRRWEIKGGCLQARVQIARKGKRKARLLSTIEYPESVLQPLCRLFGSCGGCQLQEMSLSSQREEKGKMLRRLFPDVPSYHPTIGTNEAYGYRNKIELTFGCKEYVPDPEKISPTEGSFLGFHPRGWYSKIVSVDSCSVASPKMNQVIRRLQELSLKPAWNEYNHQGVWRHVILREGNELLVALVTSSEAEERQVQEVARALKALPSVASVLWIETDRMSKVAQGDLKKILYGSTSFTIPVRNKQLQVPYDAFFQVNTAGTELLLSCIEKAAGSAQHLFDLYCGVGSIGIALAEHFQNIVGIEIHEESIRWAKKNAARNNVQGTWLAGPVETVLPTLTIPPNSVLLVDPPRVGLHPKAAHFLAQQKADTLVYVACSPGALARDRVLLEQGNWLLEEIWSIDLFPQTPHVETIAKFSFKKP